MRRPLILLAILAIAAPARGQLVKIGAAAAVRGKVSALAPAPGAVGRILSSGKEVYLRDAVTTDAQGRMQIMLLDETVFTIGPNSSLVLDEFVYDPDTGAGRMTARVTKGVFRFVSGKIARDTPSNMKVKLPIGVIGIRGTIVMGKIFSPSSALAVLMGPGARNNANERPGQMVVSAGGRNSVASKPGSGIDVTPAGPSAPYAVPQAKVDEMSGDLAPKTDDAPAKNAADSGGTASSSESSASEESGQATVGALSDLSNTESVAQATQDNSNLTDNASHDTLANSNALVPDRISNWDEVIALQGLGTVVYTGSPAAFTAGASCSGGSSNCTGTWNYSMTVDFNAASLFFDATVNTPNISLNTHSSTNAYGSMTGPAEASNGLTYGGEPNALYKFTFYNAGGIAAKQIVGEVDYNDGINSGTGAPVTTARP